MIDQPAKSEIDLIAEAADRLARRMGGTFVKDPAKVHDFPSTSENSGSESSLSASDDDDVVMT